MLTALSQTDIEPAILLDSEPRGSRLVAWAILTVSLLLFLVQLGTLYVVPIPDAVRWGGDETWLMREFGNQAHHGVMAYPESFDGTTRTDGLLAGSMWVEALLYGAAGNTFSPAHSLVDVGRTVTAVISLALLTLVWIVCRRLRVSRELSAIAVLLLVSSRAFVLATHSARYDILTGAALLAMLATLSVLAPRRRTGWPLVLAGALAVGGIIFSRHLLTLALAVSIMFAVRQKLWDDLKRFFAYASGAIVTLGILILAYVAGAKELTLFGHGGGFGSYDFVLRQLPILRPFSRSVQVSNLMERYDLLTNEAPGLLLAILIAIGVAVSYLIWRAVLRLLHKDVQVTTGLDQRFFVTSAFLSLLAWLLLQGARPYYAMHILPVAIVAAALVLQWLNETFELSAILRYPVPTLLLLVTALQIPSWNINGDIGARIVHDQREATIALISQTTPSSRVLVDVAGLNWALQSAPGRTLTLDMFQPPPNDDELQQKLAANHITHLLIRSARGVSFEPGRAQLARYLVQHAALIDRRVGFFYDDGRDYDSTLSSLLRQRTDTLSLYQVSSATP